MKHIRGSFIETTHTKSLFEKSNMSMFDPILVTLFVLSSLQYLNIPELLPFNGLVDFLALVLLLVACIAFRNFDFNLFGQSSALSMLVVFFTLFSVTGMVGALLFGSEVLDARIVVYWFSFVITSNISIRARDLRLLMLVQSFYGALSGFLALLSVLFGLSSFGPILIRRQSFNPLFDTLDSAGIFWNTNYASGMYAMGMVSSLVLVNKADLLSSKVVFGLSFLLCLFGTLCSYSRGIILGLIVAFTVEIIKYSTRRRRAFLVIIILFLLILLCLGFFDRFLYKYLRLEKGLTGRDDLWQSLRSAFSENSCLAVSGMGFAYERILIRYGSFTSTLQNSYLTYFAVGGLLSGSSVVIMIVFAIILSFSRKRRNIYWETLFIVFSVDSFFRTYLLGGMSPISLVYSIALVKILADSE